jgi:hypothetical protein
MARALIAGRWIGTGTSIDPYRSGISDDYPAADWTDFVGQPASILPPAPNVYLVLASAPDATIDAIQADSRYLVLIRTTDDPADVGNETVAPDSATITAIKTTLRAQGYTLAQVNAAITTGLTRRQIANRLIAAMRAAAHS